MVGFVSVLKRNNAFSNLHCRLLLAQSLRRRTQRRFLLARALRHRRHRRFLLHDLGLKVIHHFLEERKQTREMLELDDESANVLQAPAWTSLGDAAPVATREALL